MTSYISSFKAIWLAIAAILAVETYVYFGTEDKPFRTNIFQFAFHKPDVRQKYYIEAKMFSLTGMPAEFTQVGDSTGFYGMKPEILEQYLGGKTYLNANCCLDAGSHGPLYIAEHFLRNNPAREYLVVYISPYFLFRDTSKQLENIIEKALVGPFRFVNDIPSLRYRMEVTNGFYYFHFDRRPFQYDDKIGVADIMSWPDYFKTSHGWMYNSMELKHPTEPPYADKCNFSSELTFAQHGRMFMDFLDEARSLANRYHVKLMVIFNPVYCQFNPASNPTVKLLQKYARKHPEVIFPAGMIHPVDMHYFYDKNQHLNGEGAELYSHRVGGWLQDYLTKNAASH